MTFYLHHDEEVACTCCFLYYFLLKIWLGFREEGRAVADRGECFRIHFILNVTKYQQQHLEGIQHCSWLYISANLLLVKVIKNNLALLSDSLVLSTVTGGWRAGDSLAWALERGVHGGAGQAVAQGGPVHAPHTGQVIGGVGAHTSGQGGAQAGTWRQERWCVICYISEGL